jgi:CBS domain-containing protein
VAAFLAADRRSLPDDLSRMTLEELGFAGGDAVTCKASTFASDALALLRSAGVSTLGLVDGDGALQAVFSASDLRCFGERHFALLLLPASRFVRLMRAEAEEEGADGVAGGKGGHSRCFFVVFVLRFAAVAASTLCECASVACRPSIRSPSPPPSHLTSTSVMDAANMGGFKNGGGDAALGVVAGAGLGGLRKVATLAPHHTLAHAVVR